MMLWRSTSKEASPGTATRRAGSYIQIHARPGAADPLADRAAVSAWWTPAQESRCVSDGRASMRSARKGSDMRKTKILARLPFLLLVLAAAAWARAGERPAGSEPEAIREGKASG